MKLRYWILATVGMATFVVLRIGVVDMKSALTANTITMAIPASWGPLTSPQQSTYMASEILGNVYETLISHDMQGNLQPGLAMAWAVSEDYRRFSFKIDTSRRFSNGDHLTAKKIKWAFEHSLQVQPASVNRSTMDALYRLEGFDDFEKSGHISGIEVPSDDRLVMRFDEPFRQALSFLSGVRYAAYIITSAGVYLGTGPYLFESIAPDELLLSVNPYSSEPPAFKQVKITGLQQQEWERAICEGTVDVYWTTRAAPLPSCVRSISYQFNVTWIDNVAIDIVLFEHNFTGILF